MVNALWWILQKTPMSNFWSFWSREFRAILEFNKLFSSSSSLSSTNFEKDAYKINIVQCDLIKPWNWFLSWWPVNYFIVTFRLIMFPLFYKKARGTNIKFLKLYKVWYDDILPKLHLEYSGKQITDKTNTIGIRNIFSVKVLQFWKGDSRSTWKEH